VLTPILPDAMHKELDLIESLTLDEYQKKTVAEWILQHYADKLSKVQKEQVSMKILKHIERTIIHKIQIDQGDISYVAQACVPGYVNNQFSLSEYKGFLRVSTTLQGWTLQGYFSDVDSQNNVYVLDSNLEVVGSVEYLAPGEQIYATRFVDDICYLVTLKQIDPFFVIDLGDSANPQVLGELKIPGFSTYIHPYDDTHVIGIGRDDQSVKITFFDVTDMAHPIELATYEIENTNEDWSWIQSSALYEHKAFLCDKEKNLLVVPVGDYTKQSAYVFDINSTQEFILKGIIVHEKIQQHNDNDKYEYYTNYGYSIQRTLNIEDVLYTISNTMVKMNDITTLKELNSLLLT
jgi:uncharacterized secreted protein with C-terminal beta-propeller domain